MTLVADFNSSVNVPFQRMRALLSEGGGGLQEGVLGANDLKVVQRGAGANQSVDVGTGAAWVQIDSGTRNGLGHVYNDATANVTVTASNATNPRLDQIILRWNDSSIPTGSGNVPTLEVLTGTATAGATLDTRTGAAALPNDCLRLADILVPATSTSVTTANIRDRRPWARGACRIGSSSANANSTVATYAAIDATNLSWRIECSGAPARVVIAGLLQHTGTNVQVAVRANWDGSGLFYIWQDMLPVANNAKGFSLTIPFTPTAGSHVLTAEFANLAATLTLSALAPITMEFAELPRQSASN